jgi:uncharacterized protein YecE (DUF72 family)
MAARIRIGTSGWHYKHWKGNFYPEKTKAEQMLAHYLQHLDTVEINNCFYRLPTDEAVRSWVEQTPEDFLFALKASRYITHNRKLNDPEQTVARFMNMAQGFGNKLGPILFQLPPKWGVNPDRLGEFLAVLPKEHQYAFEFRHPSWLTSQVYDILRRFNAALCIFEIAGFRSPIELTADFTYVRLHGPGERAYQGKYSDVQLQTWARTVEAWAGANCGVYFYFDNDQAGYAVQNAIELAAMVWGHKTRNPAISLAS